MEIRLVVYDAGVFCHAMSSNYNLKMRPQEYLVDGDKLTCIRRVEPLDDYLSFSMYKHIVPTKSTPNARLAFGGNEE